MSLTDIDSRDVVARSQFIEEASSPLSGVPLNTPHNDVFIVDAHQQRQDRPARPPRQSRNTRQYRRVTNAQKMELTNLFRQNGDDMSAKWYSQQVGIRLSRTRDLLSKLRNGQVVMPEGHYRRRSRVEPFQHLIARGLTKKPTISIGCLWECLQRLIDECGAVSEDDVLAIDPERLDRFVNGEEQPQERRDDGGVPAGDLTNADERMALGNDDTTEVTTVETDDEVGGGS